MSQSLDLCGTETADFDEESEANKKYKLKVTMETISKADLMCRFTVWKFVTRACITSLDLPAFALRERFYRVAILLQ